MISADAAHPETRHIGRSHIMTTDLIGDIRAPRNEVRRVKISSLVRR